MTSKSEQLYHKHHVEFEKWFDSIHPNHGFCFEWIFIHDCGFYKEDMHQGAWIAWLSLTGKNIEPDTIESLLTEIKDNNENRSDLMLRAEKPFFDLLDECIEKDNLENIKSLIAQMPECSIRMKLAGKLALIENNKKNAH